MKYNRYNAVAFAAGMVMFLGVSGCSVFKPNKAQDGKEKGLQGWVTGEEGESSSSSKSNIGKGNAKSDKASADAMKKLGESAALAGDWAITDVLGKKAVGETAPFMKFVPSEGRMYGNNGCNIMNGSYTVGSDGNALSFGNIATTMMMCGQQGITDVEIGQALGMTVRYSIESTDSDSVLRLYDADGKVVMELLHRDFHFLDGTWAVTAIDGEEVNIEGMKLALDVDEKRLHGNTGCNIINGEFETDMETANSISFSKIGMTRMACHDSGWETRMVMALEEAVTAKKISADKVELIGSNGKQVMLLKRTTPIDD